MGSNVRHRFRFGRGGGKAAVIAGAAAALLSTGTAAAANITPTDVPAATVSHHNPAAHHSTYKPRTGSGRDAVRLDPRRRIAAGQLVPDRPSLGRVAVL
jgi:hypothetical protein